MSSSPYFLVVGHGCVDLTPKLPSYLSGGGGGSNNFLRDVFRPGSLIPTESASFSLGGAVPNTGLALHKLMTPENESENVKLVCCVQDDTFGDVMKSLVVKNSGGDQRLVQHLITLPGAAEEQQQTSFSIIFSPPGCDRFILHCTGVNALLTSSMIPEDLISSDRCCWLHLGYPPVLPALLANDGFGLHQLFNLAKTVHGKKISLDMCSPGKDLTATPDLWPRVLRRILPLVDVFTPSVEEIVECPGLFPDSFKEEGKMFALSSLREVGRVLVDDYKAGTLLLKLGSRGAYVKTADAEYYAPCFKPTQFVGTTGAGDCTVAAFILACSKSLPISRALQLSVAVGACNVSEHDAFSGLRTLCEIERDVAEGWERQPISPDVVCDDTCSSLLLNGPDEYGNYPIAN
eukprot:PhM_4_TR3753/c0_g1_i2/m.30416